MRGSEGAHSHDESETGQQPDRAGGSAYQGEREVTGRSEPYPGTHLNEVGIAQTQEALNLQSVTRGPKEVLE